MSKFHNFLLRLHCSQIMNLFKRLIDKLKFQKELQLYIKLKQYQLESNKSLQQVSEIGTNLSKSLKCLLEHTIILCLYLNVKYTNCK